MSQASLAQRFSSAIVNLPLEDDDYVPQLVNVILEQAAKHRASDVHLVPTEHQLTMRWRVDGVLHSVAAFDSSLRSRVVARLKVLAALLTYRSDVPQEGRIAARDDQIVSDAEIRVTTFPTLFGEKVAVRLFAATRKFHLLKDLGLTEDIETSLRTMMQSTSGVVLLTGPSGSGKTTTAYACLREITQLVEDSRELMTLEDPVEVVVPGVTQSQVRPSVGFDLACGLKSVMRQDPDVIMIGEIRDPETAECAFQAALTGHLVITTFHAGSSVEALTRLQEMGIEPYLLRSTLRAVICQRLLRRACSDCRGEVSVSAKVSNSTNLPDKVMQTEDPSDQCQKCGGLKYHGRFVAAELLDPSHPELSQAILNCVDAPTLQSVANDCGTVTLQMRSDAAVKRGDTYPEEVFRVLGRC